MEPSAETRKAPVLFNKVIVIVGAIVIALLATIVVILLRRQPLETINDGGTPKIGYATDAKVMLDQDSLQAAMDAAMENARNGNISLRYKNNAYSSDGITFECVIANSASNIYDMYLTIFADVELKDQIFLSELVPPGSGFESITLDHALDPGDHTVYVALTQVDTDSETGEQVIKNQVMHTMEFHVTG